MPGPSWRSRFLILEELVQDMRWAEEQARAGQGALGHMKPELSFGSNSVLVLDLSWKTAF